MPPNLDLSVSADRDTIIAFATNTWRPEAFAKNGVPVTSVGIPLISDAAVRTNAFLYREEWERIDEAVFRLGKLRTNAYADVISSGLTRPSDISVWYSTWKVSGERTAARVQMEFQSGAPLDRTERKQYGVPIPLITCGYSIGRRELLTSRRTGAGLDTTEAEESTEAVMEKAEDILINGETSVVIEGQSIPGYVTHTARETGTAASYGGGDFGTLANIYPTFLGVLTAMQAKRYHGPFTVYIHPTQYNQMLEYYSDGTGRTALERCEALPQISGIKPNDLIATAGHMIWVQLERKVVDVEVAMTLQNRQWESLDGNRFYFVVCMSAVPRVKQDFDGNNGIAHVTSC